MWELAAGDRLEATTPCATYVQTKLPMEVHRLKWVLSCLLPDVVLFEVEGQDVCVPVDADDSPTGELNVLAATIMLDQDVAGTKL